MRYILYMLSATLLMASFSACAKDRSTGEQQDFTVVAGNKRIPIKLEVADDAAERELGLMYRQELPKRTGMLFVFPDEKPRSFWMKNTYLSLDLLFVNSAGKVLDIIENAVPLSEKNLTGKGAVKYVIELPAGSSAEEGIKPGAQVEGLIMPY